MFLAMYSNWLVIFLFIFSIISAIPATANASLFSALSSIILGNLSVSSDISLSDNLNSQNVPLLQNSTNFNASAAVGGGDIIVANNDALVSESGPSGTLADVSDSANTGQISKYKVQKGDTLSGIAKMFGVSVNTIIWANNVTATSVQPGDTLIILPVSGTLHKIANGDTLQSIAKKYKADAGEIAQFNGIDQSSPLTVGDSIIIPDGEGAYINPSSLSGRRSGNEPYLGGSGPDYQGYYIRPIVGGVKTQGLHGWNAIDLGTPVGTSVFAAASGEVLISRASGWNGGYGRYIVISHANGTETVYGHLSVNYVSAGEFVFQGQVIGLTGNTGNSTGPHLHFEVRGAYNFMQDPSEY